LLWNREKYLKIGTEQSDKVMKTEESRNSRKIKNEESKHCYGIEKNT
jgi:hypothetical protein